MSKALILLAAAAFMSLSLWLVDYKWGMEALDYQECGGRYCEPFDPPSAAAYKR